VLLAMWRRRGIRVLRTVHNAVAHEDTRATKRDAKLWARADVLIAHSAGAVAELQAAVPGADVRHIPVDLPAASPPSRVDARRALGLGDAPLALLLGLIRRYKGVDLLGAAWPSVHEAVPNARLAVVGSLLEPLAALDELGARDGVDVRVGWMSDDDIARWAAAADVCLLPYAHGGHSAILHQAVAAGTPVIASPTLAEEVSRFHAGIVVDLEPEKWSAAVASALGPQPLPPPKRPDMREQAHATAALYCELVDPRVTPRG
jgi:glycosyltransferase involved in cell wall biosynthesis